MKATLRAPANRVANPASLQRLTTRWAQARRCKASLALLYVLLVYSITFGASTGLSETTEDTVSLTHGPDLTLAILAAANAKGMSSQDPRFGTVVNLLGSDASSLRMKASIGMIGGTISFWIKPRWRDASVSHTFLSAHWSDPRQSYLTISQGWWEPSGSGRLYFIVSNEDVVHCSSEMTLPTEVWLLVTVTWASGSHGFCKLYVDDEMRAVFEHSWAGRSTLDEFAVGSDSNATDRRGRIAEASMAALKIMPYPATHREVIARYRSEEDPAAYEQKKWSWLAKSSSDSKRPDVRAGRGGPFFGRAIFDEDMTWANGPAIIDERLRRIRAAGFNVYVPCVWHGRGSAYSSRVAAVDPRLKPADRGWDALAYLVERAHRAGIAVYPWYTVARREDDSHPEWAEPGTPPGAFCLHQPGFRDFAVKLMLDVVSRYDVDGLNLDYIRAMGICTSDSCRRDYRAETGADLLEDLAHGSPNTAAKHRIRDWQDAAVEDLVSKVAAGARKLKPKLILSMDGYAIALDEGRPLEGRNEILWANRGWIDVIFHMDYRAEVDTEALNAAQKSLLDSSKLWLLVSDYDSIDGTPIPRSGEWISRAVDYAENTHQGRGIGIYLYGRLSDEQIQALRSLPKSQ